MHVSRSPRQASRRAALRVLFAAFPGRTALLAVLALLAGVLPAVFAVLVGLLVSVLPDVSHRGFASPAGRHLLGVLAAVAVVLIATELVSSAQEIVSTSLYQRFDGHLLRRVMAAALSRDDLALFEDPALAARLDRGVQLARYGPGELVSGLSAQWTVRAQGLSAAVLVGWYWPAAAASLGLLWVIVARALQASYYRAEPFWTDPLRRARYYHRVAMLPHWAKEVRVFGLARWLSRQYATEWSAVMAQLWRARRADHRQMAVLGCVVLLAHVLVAFALARSVSTGTLTTAAIVVIIQGLFGMTLLASLSGDTWIENGAVPVPDALELERTVRPAASAAARPARPAGTGKTVSPADGLPRQAIEFRDVSFRYPGSDRPVLTNLNLRIEAGRSLAIVGLTGAGKTTLVRLLTGLCEPVSGSILVDDVPLTGLDLTSWRQQIAVIFQDFVRYELPLADNIAFGAIGQPGIGDRDIAEVAALAGAARLVSDLPQGLATVLSPRFPGGADLSGGQWQRVAFARALMAVRAGAKVLVMDEPTAHLDVRAEARMYTRFLGLTRNLTSVVISHRFAAVRQADRIVVLAGGQVAESGSHDELIAAAGQYARLFAVQAARYQDAAAHDPGEAGGHSDD